MPREFGRSTDSRSPVDNGVSGMSQLFLRCPRCRRGVYCYYPSKVQRRSIEKEEVLKWVNEKYPGCPKYPLKGLVNHLIWETVEVPREAFTVWEPMPRERKYSPRRAKIPAA